MHDQSCHVPSCYGQKRRHLNSKRWGVFTHHLVDRVHPLVAGVNTRFDVPHSRFNQIDRKQFEAAGLKVLAESQDAGVHLAVSEDLFRLVFFQGHPEYDIISLLKEYKREANRFINGELNHYPPFPQNYFRPLAQAILDEHYYQVLEAKHHDQAAPEFPEKIIAQYLDNTWHDTAEAVINNWIGQVYQLTHMDRNKAFQDTINPDDPLGIRQA